MNAAERIAAEITGMSEDAATEVLAAALKLHTKKMTPVDSLRFYRRTSDFVTKCKDSLSSAILASVGMIAGSYNGFTVVDCSGRASVNTPLLEEQFPDAYAATVKWGKPFQTIRIHKD